MKIVNFNVNGIRARLDQVKAVIDKHSPDIMCFQEIKCIDGEMPSFENFGYTTYTNGQKGHYGVAILSRIPLLEVKTGLDDEFLDTQRRSIQATFLVGGEEYFIKNLYCPNGENRNVEVKFTFKQKFYEKLAENLQNLQKKHQNILVMGDMNIAPFDDDIGIGEENRKRWLKDGHCCFLPEEREWLSKIYGLGFIDLYDEFVKKNAIEKKYSWFDYRSKGFEKEPKRGLRIDLMLATGNFVSKNKLIEIDYEIRALPKTSDHVPILGEFLL